MRLDTNKTKKIIQDIQLSTGKTKGEIYHANGGTVSYATIMRALAGGNTSANTVGRIARILNVDPEDIIEKGK